MSSVVPILADNALNHLIRGVVFGVRIGPMADAINTLEVLIVSVQVIS
jgi:hypothetical protein